MQVENQKIKDLIVKKQSKILVGEDAASRMSDILNKDIVNYATSALSTFRVIDNSHDEISKISIQLYFDPKYENRIKSNVLALLAVLYYNCSFEEDGLSASIDENCLAYANGLFGKCIGEKYFTGADAIKFYKGTLISFNSHNPNFWNSEKTESYEKSLRKSWNRLDYADIENYEHSFDVYESEVYDEDERERAVPELNSVITAFIDDGYIAMSDEEHEFLNRLSAEISSDIQNNLFNLLSITEVPSEDTLFTLNLSDSNDLQILQQFFDKDNNYFTLFDMVDTTCV